MTLKVKLFFMKTHSLKITASILALSLLAGGVQATGFPKRKNHSINTEKQIRFTVPAPILSEELSDFELPKEIDFSLKLRQKLFFRTPLPAAEDMAIQLPLQEKAVSSSTKF